MAENKKLCEEIEIAIYSDTELTEEQKNHIENCESCKALLSQISQMKNDLGTVSVPGIAEGQIAKAVMDNIKQQKTSVAFPKFKITHHLGTAVAVAIILVAALIIKNPAEVDDDEISAKDFENTEADYSGLPNDTSFSPAYEASSGDTDQGDTNIHSTEEAENMNSENFVMLKTKTISDDEIDGTLRASDTTNESTNEAPVKLTSARPKNSTEQTQDTTANNTAYLFDSDNIPESDANDGNTSTGGGGGGAGGGSSAAEPVTPAMGSAYSIPETPKKEYIFEGVEFLSGEENFDYNISIANQRLNERFGPEYRLSKEKLKKIGFNNDRLITIASTITLSMFETFKNTLDIFE